MAGEGRQIERCHKHEQMAEDGVGKSEKERERKTGRVRQRERERGRKIWIRLKKASSSLWGMQ